MSTVPGALIRVLVAAACLPALAVTGIVSDAYENRLEGVGVCLMHGKTKQECVKTDANGAFELPDSRRGIVVVDSRDHLPAFAPADGHHRFRLVEAPQLLVHLVDDVTGEPIIGGEVYVLFSSAIKRGPFPTGRGGVRISRPSNGIVCWSCFFLLLSLFCSGRCSNKRGLP